MTALEAPHTKKATPLPIRSEAEQPTALQTGQNLLALRRDLESLGLPQGALLEAPPAGAPRREGTGGLPFLWHSSENTFQFTGYRVELKGVTDSERFAQQRCQFLAIVFPHENSRGDYPATISELDDKVQLRLAQLVTQAHQFGWKVDQVDVRPVTLREAIDAAYGTRPRFDERVPKRSGKDRDTLSSPPLSLASTSTASNSTVSNSKTPTSGGPKATLRSRSSASGGRSTRSASQSKPRASAESQLADPARRTPEPHARAPARKQPTNVTHRLVTAIASPRALPEPQEERAIAPTQLATTRSDIDQSALAALVVPPPAALILDAHSITQADSTLAQLDSGQTEPAPHEASAPPSLLADTNGLALEGSRFSRGETTSDLWSRARALEEKCRAMGWVK